MLLEIAIFRAIIWLLWPTPFLANTAILHTVQQGIDNDVYVISNYGCIERDQEILNQIYLDIQQQLGVC